MWPVPLAAAGSVESLLIEVLPVFILAAGVGVFVAKVGRFPYTIALLLAGLAVSVLGATAGVSGRLIDVRLTHDLIFLVLLPPLLFEGAATTDLGRLRRNLAPVLALAVIGLVVSTVLVGVVGARVFDFAAAGVAPALVALLFASMVLPTDPVSVLALFEELGAPERLSVLVEGESLVNDGVGVVLFSTFLAVVEAGTPLSTFLRPGRLGLVALEVAVVSLGGLLVGFAAGFAVYSVMRELDDHMTEVVLAFILAYGSFLLAEHYLHVSGVIATVVAGLFVGNRGAEKAMSPQTRISVFNALETAAFLVNTFIFVMIGVITPVDELVSHAELIAIAVPLVLAARAAVVYPIAAGLNRIVEPEVSTAYQHVLVWGGLHGSIPVALALGLESAALPGPLVTKLKAMTFGVAAFSLVVQGLTMGSLLERLGVVTRSETERLHELLLGRARAVDAALDAAERLNDEGELTGEVYEDFTAEYEREKSDLNDAISQLLSEHPELRRQQVRAGERRLLQEEKSALMGAMRRGRVSDDAGEQLLREVDVKLDRVREGETTVASDREGYEEFWRERAAAAGLEVEPRAGGDGAAPDPDADADTGPDPGTGLDD